MTRTQRIITSLLAVTFLLSAGFVALPATTQAFTPGDPESALSDVNDTLDLNDSDDAAFDTIANIINIGLGLLGLIFFVLVLYAGFLWMTASGNGDQVGKAKTMLTQAVIGLIIVLAAFAISNFVISQLISAASSTPSAP